MTEDDIFRKILDASFKAHTELGPGLLESVYEVVLAHELREMGLSVERQVPIPIVYDGLQFEAGFRADLVVHELVIVELKAVEALTNTHRKQLLTQLRLGRKRLGLLINFSCARLKEGIVRVANGLPTKHDDPPSF